MAFRDMMTGGACNVQDTNSGQRNMNPLNKLFDNLIIGPQQPNQQSIVQKELSQNQNMIQQRENMFTEMNQGWQDAKQQHQHSMMQDKMMMQNMWQQEKQNHEYHMMMQQKMQSDIWKNEEQNYMAEKMVKEFEESQKQDPVKEQENINRAADSMIDIMKQDDSPRFKNSKFLGFLKDIQSQKIKIENDQVVVNEQHQADFFEDAYKEAEQDYKFDQQEFMSMWDKQKEMYANQQQHQQQHFEEQFEAAKEEYEFAQMNEFLAENDPFEQAQQLIDQGKTYEAILALEAGLQKQNNDKAWHLLGRLHQEMDDDKRALACLLKAHEADQNNLDVLLALGVSCTNNLDEDDAMKFLRRWIENNPKYQLKNLPQENNVENIINIFTQTSNSHNNSDPELLTVLSVLHFIDRDYDQAVHYFKASLKLDPSNYSLWNKLGATLAHLGHADEAMQAYGKALELKPNYVRVWVNLGIAQAYKQNYKEAARLYLNALSFNPKAEHLWNYLQTNFMCMQRFDLSDQTLNRDINAFRSEFKILNIEDLPKPQIDCKNFMLDKKAKNEFLIKQDEWAREFNS